MRPTVGVTLRGVAASAALVAASGLGTAGCIGSGDDNLVPVPVVDAGADAHDATIASDGAPLDACTSDAARCNSCVTTVADPYNACSRFASGCIPFDAARIQPHPTL